MEDNFELTKDNIDESVSNIINNSMFTKEEKIKKLNKLKKQADFGLLVVDGKLKYCQECKTFYFSDSYIYKSKEETISVCTYEDPINSGGNEYKDKLVTRYYERCPKGHQKRIEFEDIPYGIRDI